MNNSTHSAPHHDWQDLEQLRAEIEAIDVEIVALLGKRLGAVKAVGAIKRKLGLAFLDPAREAEVVSRVARASRERDLPEDDMRAVYWRILAMSRGAQQLE